jgi:hypothetical protein
MAFAYLYKKKKVPLWLVVQGREFVDGYTVGEVVYHGDSIDEAINEIINCKERISILPILEQVGHCPVADALGYKSQSSVTKQTVSIFFDQEEYEYESDSDTNPFVSVIAKGQVGSQNDSLILSKHFYNFPHPKEDTFQHSLKIFSKQVQRMLLYAELYDTTN